MLPDILSPLLRVRDGSRIVVNDKILGCPWRYGFTVCALVMVFLYLPALVRDFGVHNDYMAWSYSNRKCCLRFPESIHLLSVGRPLGALLLNLQFAAFNDIGALAWGRALSLLTILAAYYLFCLILIKNYKFSSFFSVFLGLLIFLLPSVILYVMWLTNFIPGSLALLISLISYFWISRPDDEPAHQKSRRVALLRRLGYVSLFISFFVYPPISIFCLVVPLVCVLFMDSGVWLQAQRRILAQIVIISGLLGAYFVFTKFVLTPFLWNVSQAVRDYIVPTSNYQFSLSTNPFTKTYLINEFLAITFNFWTSNYLPWLYLLVIFFIVGVALLKVGGLFRFDREHRSVAYNRALTVLLLFAIGATPVFAPKDGFIAYRIVFTAASMALVLFIWALYEFCTILRNPKLLVFLLMIVSGFAFVFSSLRIQVFVDNVSREYEFVRNSVRGLNLEKVTKVVVVAPPWGAQIVRDPLFYDFRYMGTNFARMDGIVRAALQESGMSPRKARKINVSFVPPSIADSPELKKYFCPCVDMAWAGFQASILPFSLAMGPMIPASPNFSESGEKVGAAESDSGATVKEGVFSGPQMIVEGYLGYNIVLYNAKIYGFPQGFNPNYKDPNLTKIKGVLVGNSVTAIISEIDRIPAKENIGLRAPRLVVENYSGYNIVSFRDKFFGFPPGFSPDYEDSNLAKSPGVLLGSTEAMVKALIDQQSARQRTKSSANRKM